MSSANAVYGAQGTMLSVPRTPSREKERHPFPNQSPLRHPTTSLLTSLPPAPSNPISPQTMTVESLLKQHAATSDPKKFALEQAVNDRNVLSAQNAQLWKLIEKQRAGYNQILKELERIRGERDGYKSKLISLGAPPNPERRRKQSFDHASKPSVELPANLSSLQAQKKYPVQRHNSDDTGLTPPTNVPRPLALNSSRSMDPLSIRPADTVSSAQDSFETTSHSPRTPKPLEHFRFNESSGDSTTMPSRMNGNYTPIRPNARKGSLAESVSSVVTTTSSVFSHSTASVSSNNHSGSSSSFVQYGPTQSAIISRAIETLTATERVGTQTGSSDHANQPSQGLSSSTSNTPTHQSLSRLAPVPEDRHLSRESRISLPEEAKQYIKSMTDSPVLSPGVDTFLSKQQLGISINPPPRSSSVQSDHESEFLDMGDEESNEELVSEDALDATGSDVRQAQSAQIQLLQYEQDRVSHQPFHQSLSQSSDSSREDIGLAVHKQLDKSRAGPEEFPSPPYQPIRSENTSPQDDQHRYGLRNSPPQNPVMQRAATSSPVKTLPSDSFGSTAPSHSAEISQGMPTIPASFRALPLLSSDLPSTTVAVSHSFVRPNDRGKEVLSFIVSVNPGNGKESWRVEKMYSDVLSMDQRVRSSVGKGLGKRIANLPEGKLWKDHAPAKVDQRKAILEHYLQSLIRLPVKNNDEVIAFFTSDIVREQNQPVMQVGHKEGYLTKRGKNFGGWKTRFFVLQGPVLEYYDCRGGTHLGSITITGAQIARQHKTERSVSSDGEREYRHAFLIVEATKAPGGNSARHVLCAESDEDRDSWVEMLVRYYTGTYSEDLVLEPPSGMTFTNSNSSAAANNMYGQPRSSTSSDMTSPRAKPSRAIREEISRAPAQPTHDPTIVKIFRPAPTSDDYTRSSSPSRSIEISSGDRLGLSNIPESQKRLMERSGLGLPSSLPDSSPLSSGISVSQESIASSSATRANSELGHYSDLHDNRNASRQNFQEHRLKVERVPTPDRSENKTKISGPMNGAPIPAGFKFGGKDPSAELSANERREKSKSRSFWGFGKGEKQPHSIPRNIFGVPLEEALDVSQICNLPSIVFRSIQYLEAKKADQEEGIYRLSGSSTVIKSLKDRFNNEGDIDLLGSEEYWDPHAIAGLLKTFLRELPSSILTRELHLRFLAVIDFVDPQERIRELSQLIAALPLVNYSLLRALTAHLIHIVQNSHVNKMTMRNVGIVFSPTLGIPAGVFSLMLGEFNRVFNVDAVPDTDTEFVDQSTELLRRNSQRYSAAAADQLLGLSGRTLLQTSPAEDTQSEGDADDSSVHEESGTESTEGEEVSSSSSPVDIRVNSPDTPETPVPRFSKAQHAASSKGLNLIVATSERGNRHSRMIGLPLSPRPQHSPARQEKLP